jgi:hypothetical protein
MRARHSVGRSARRLGAACALVPVGALAASAAPPQGAPGIETLRQKLVGVRSAFRSVRAEVHRERRWTDDYYRLTGTPASAPATHRSEGTWAANNAAVYMAYRTSADDASGSPASSMLAFTDGRRRVRVEENALTGRQDVFIATRPGAPDSPLEYGFTNRGTWYSDVVATPGFRVTGESRDPTLGRLLLVEGPSGPRGRLMVSFACDRGHLAVRTEARAQPEAERSSRTVWRVTSAERVAGVWLPVAFEWEWSLLEKGRVVPMDRRTYRVTAPEVGADCRALLRTPEFRAGAMVHDEDKQAYYRVADDGSLQFAGKVGDRAPTWPLMLGPGAWLSVAGLGAVLAVGGAGYARRAGRRR